MDGRVARSRGHRLATFSYVAALLVIASLSIGTHVLIDSIVQAQQTTAKVINVAGRQRMLSQRIASLSLQLDETPWGEARDRLLREMGDSVALMERSYRALRRGDHPWAFPAAESPRVARIYDEEPHNLALRLDAFLAHSRAYLAAKHLGLDDAEALEALRAAAMDGLLQRLDLAVAAYQSDAEDAIGELRRVLFGVLGLMLATLVAEALFIFRPLFLRLAQREEQLVDLAAELDQALTMSTAELRLAGNIIQHTDEGICVISDDGVILSVNPAFCGMTGYSRAEVLGKPMQILRSERHDDAVYDAVWTGVRANGSWSGEIWIRRSEGAFLAHVTVNPLSDDLAGTGAAYVGMFADVTELRHKDETIRHLSFHDALTGVPNRERLWEDLTRMVKRRRAADEVDAVVSVDLDRFKVVNDSFGQAMGDAVLREATARMAGEISATDTLARMGADEFAVLLVGRTSVAECAAVAAAIVAALAKPFALGGETVRVGASVGVALCPGDGETAADLLRQATGARLLAKQKGGGYQLYQADLDQAIRRRLRLEIDLRATTQAEGFFLEYQPKVDLETGEAVGVEALIRWRHPEFGLVPPSQFIPLAEDIGAIHDLGDWVLRESCAQAQRFRDSGLVASVAANISAKQFHAGGLPERIAALLGQTGLPPELLQLEITESSVIGEPEETRAQLARLRDMGIRVALDDFGTGYSSLSYLRDLPIDFVKIDRSFVAHLENNATDVTVARGIVTLGHALGLKIIAEGVETEGQATILKAMDCDIGQGYLFAKPLTAAAAPGWIARHTSRRRMRLVT